MPSKWFLPLQFEGPPPGRFEHSAHLHGLVHGQLEGVDSELGARTHNSQERPGFTLSPLDTLGEGTVSLKLTFLDSTLEQVLMSRLQSVSQLNLKGRSFRPCWPAATRREVDYEGLLRKPYPNLRFPLELLSPTAIHLPRNERSDPRRAHPLPDMTRYFDGWRKLWNRHASHLTMGPEVSERIRRSAAVAFCRGETRAVALRQRKFIGFVGNVTFELRGEVPREQVQQLAALARLATFCGTGVGTLFGMGQTRGPSPFV